MPAADVRCAFCKTPMRSLGEIPIRVGGTTGGWHFFLGNLADVQEAIIALDTYRCDTCRRVEFFDLDLSLPAEA